MRYKSELHFIEETNSDEGKVILSLVKKIAIGKIGLGPDLKNFQCEGREKWVLKINRR